LWRSLIFISILESTPKSQMDKFSKLF
jgi:hypothetical protein